MSEREQLEQSIAALEGQRAVLGDAVVDPAIAALRSELTMLETPSVSPPRAVVEAGEKEQRKQVTAAPELERVETRTVGREIELRRLQEALYEVMEERTVRVVTIVGEVGVGKSRLLHEFDKWTALLPETVLRFKGWTSQQTRDLPYALICDLLSRRFDIRYSDAATLAREKLERGIVALLGTGNGEGIEKAHFIGQLIGFDFSDSPYLRGITNDAQQIHDRAFHYIAQLFTAATSPGHTGKTDAAKAVALFLEDIHWADDGSLDLVDHLTRECRHSPLLIVAPAQPQLFERRPSWGDPSIGSGQVLSPLVKAGGQVVRTRLDLRPLSRRNSRRLVREILHKVDEIPPDLRNLIVDRAGGNPFYIEELIKVLIEDGVIVKSPDRWQVKMERLVKVRIPPTLTEVLQTRLEELPPSERRMLQRASVVGQVFWDGAVERIGESWAQRTSRSANGQADASEIGGTLRTLRRRGLILEREASAFTNAREYIFNHAILRDVTYESVPQEMRQTYHGRTAVWLIVQSGSRVREWAGLIGRHYELAGMRTPAAEWYGRAGRQAQDTYALEAALGYYQQALALKEDWEWRKGQVEVLHTLGQRDDEQAALRALEVIPKAPVFDVAYLWGQYHEAVGEYAQAQAAVERAQAAAQERDDIVGEVRCLTQLGLIARRQGDFDRAKAEYSRALILLKDQEISSDEKVSALARALSLLGDIHRQQGDFERALDCDERALALNRASGNRKGEAEVLNGIGGTLFYQRRFAEAWTYYRQALEIWRAIGDLAGEGVGLSNLAMASREMRDYERAQECLSEALAIHQATGDRWEQVNAWNSLGIQHYELGDLPQARSCLERGLQLAQEIGDEEGQAYLLANLGLVARDQGDLTAAGKLLADGMALVQTLDSEFQESTFLSYMSTVSLQAGRFEEAVERAERALALRRRLDLRLNTADDLATLAAAYLGEGDIGQALAYAQEALAILEECGGEGPEFPQRDYFVCYRVLAAAGQAERADVTLQSAHDLVMARADKITDPDLRQSYLERVPVNREIVREMGLE